MEREREREKEKEKESISMNSSNIQLWGNHFAFQASAWAHKLCACFAFRCFYETFGQAGVWNYEI